MIILRIILMSFVCFVGLTQTARAVPAPMLEDFEIRHYFQFANVNDFDEYIFFQHVPYYATDGVSGDWFLYSSDFEMIIESNSIHSIPEGVNFVEVYALKKSYVDFEELLSLNTEDNKNRINSYFYTNSNKWIKANIDLVHPGDLGWARDYDGVTDVYTIRNFSEEGFELHKEKTVKNYVDRSEDDWIGKKVMNGNNYLYLLLIVLFVIVVIMSLFIFRRKK